MQDRPQKYETPMFTSRSSAAKTPRLKCRHAPLAGVVGWFMLVLARGRGGRGELEEDTRWVFQSEVEGGGCRRCVGR